MLIDLKTLIKKYDMDIRGVIHIGAHNGNEYDVYKNLGIKEMAFFEPQMDIFKELKRKVGMFAWNYALGNFNGKTKMYVASNGQSSTLLEPKEHLNQYPGITFNGLQLCAALCCACGKVAYRCGYVPFFIQNLI